MEFGEFNDLGLFYHFTEAEEMESGFLTEKELELISNRHRNKQLDFIRGRTCAKMALKKMGIPIANVELLSEPDGQVSWPEGVVGSISHSKGLAGAIVGWKKDFQSLGLDIELRNRVQPEIWDRLFTEFEQEVLLQFPMELQSEKATEIFSLKEAFYKFQWPLTKTFLGMRDVEWKGHEFAAGISSTLPTYRCFTSLYNQHHISVIVG
jgi:4'-phosphopantetheinyl transferase EntD